MFKQKRITCLALFAAILFCATPAFSQTYGEHSQAAGQYFEAKQYDKALQQYLICDYEIPNDFITNYMIAATLSYLGDGRTAKYYFDKLLTIADPNTHDYNEALSALHRFGYTANERPGDGQSVNLASAGTLFMMHGQYDQAIQFFKDLLKSNHNSIFAYEIGIAYARMHDSAHAVEWLKKAYELCPAGNFRALIVYTQNNLALIADPPANAPGVKRTIVGAQFLPGPPQERPPM